MTMAQASSAIPQLLGNRQRDGSKTSSKIVKNPRYTSSCSNHFEIPIILRYRLVIYHTVVEEKKQCKEERGEEWRIVGRELGT